MPIPDPSQKRFYRFQLQSLNRSKPVSAAVKEIRDLAPRMAADLADDDAEIQIQVKREEAIPLDPLTIIIIVEVLNLTARPLLEGFFKKLGEKMADYFTDQVHDLVVLEKDESETEPPATSQ
jgi:hypothetical protein